MRKERRNTGRSALAALALAALALGAGAAGGAPSGLDRTFSGTGRTALDAGGLEAAAALAVLPDGRILLAGSTTVGNDAVVFRLGPSGTPDPTFGGDGAVALDSGGAELAHAIAFQRDGKVVVAGRTSVGEDAAVYRLRLNGKLDPTFDGDGRAALDSGGSEEAYGVAVQRDGKIVVAGETSVDDDAVVYRLRPNGLPDPSFGGDGSVAIDGGAAERAKAVALQHDGRIVLAGFTSAGGNGDAAVYRLRPNGKLDPTFDGDGRVALDAGGTEEAEALAIQPDGRILVAGDTSVGDDAVVYRLRRNGSLDRTFSGDGLVTLDAGGDEIAFGLAVQADGKILVAGRTTGSAVVYRLNPNGSRDASFGTGGVLTIAVGELARAAAVALQRNGRILLAGTAGGDAVAVRLRGTRPPRCGGVFATIVGTKRGDRIAGTPGRDVIAGLAGNDTIRGLAGNDVLCGGPGNDRLVGGPGRDRLIGGPGRDRTTQ